jgi:hypothetical protein
MANPGLAKSTMVYNWARRNGYHTETLIGSRFSQEEILGFQVRVEDARTGQQYLEILPPHWYRNIIEAETRGVPSVLFLDELSTAQEHVQGALLQLVFERTIGHGRSLPETTLIIAAANYKQNIPWQFNIMAPILNRFCIVNLRYASVDSFLNEFLQDEADWTQDPVRFIAVEQSKAQEAAVRNALKMMVRTLFLSFEKEDTGYVMDLNNQAYNTLYDQSVVYNFISGRSLFWLSKLTASFLRKGLSMEAHGPYLMNMVFGLVGAGTNTFNEEQQKGYLKSLETLYGRLYTALAAGAYPGAAATRRETMDFTGKSAADAINEWLLYHESSLFYGESDPLLALLASHVAALYSTEREALTNLRDSITGNQAAFYAFSNDMRRIDSLVTLLDEEAAFLFHDRQSDVEGASLTLLRDIRDALTAFAGEAV